MITLYGIILATGESGRWHLDETGNRCLYLLLEHAESKAERLRVKGKATMEDILTTIQTELHRVPN